MAGNNEKNYNAENCERLNRGEEMNCLQCEYSCECNETHPDLLSKARSNMPDMNEIFGIAELFKVFGDSTRARILWCLISGELCVCDIAELLGMTKSAVSHQLRVLRQAKLVTPRRSGKEVYYSLADDHVIKILNMAKEHIEE